MNIFDNPFTIQPGANGSFIVRDQMNNERVMGDIYGFTNVNDLMTWLQQQAAQFENNRDKVRGDQVYAASKEAK